MGIFGRSNNSDKEASLTLYTIGIMMLENIPKINKDYLSVDIFDLTVMQLKIPSRNRIKEEIINGRRVRRNVISPEVIFNLKYDTDRVSLMDCLLPNHNVLAARAIIVENESEKKVIDSQEYYIRIVFDLFVFTRKSLIKTNQTYEDYQDEILNIKQSHKEEMDELRERCEEIKENAILYYKKNEEDLRTKLEEKDEKILELTSTIPDEMNNRMLRFVRKLNKTADINTEPKEG